jgi:hypothetical protein
MKATDTQKNNQLNMKTTLLILFSFLFVSFGDFRDQIFCEVRCCSGNSPLDNSIKFSEEGLTCKNPTFNLKKERTLFIDYFKLDKEKIKNLQDYLERKNFMNDSTASYYCKEIRLGNPWVNRIILRQYDNFKIIKYDECYNQSIDSIFYYMNDLIPEKKKHLYEITPPNPRQCQCIKK